jgi:hypothetical protein
MLLGVVSVGSVGSFLVILLYIARVRFDEIALKIDDNVFAYSTVSLNFVTKWPVFVGL